MNDYDLRESVLQQFRNSAVLNALIKSFADKMQIGERELMDKIFSVDNAQGVQLDRIGKLVGASRVIRLGAETIVLSDNDFRTFIKMKAFANVNNTSISAMNQAIRYIWANKGSGYVQLAEPFVLHFYFDFELEPYEKALIVNRYFPLPAGYAVEIFTYTKYFGFSGTPFRPFNQGIFFNGAV